MTRCALDKTVQSAGTGAGQNVTGPIGVTSGGRGGTTGSFRLVNKQRGGGFIAELNQRTKTKQNSVPGTKTPSFVQETIHPTDCCVYHLSTLPISQKSTREPDGRTDAQEK